MQDKIGSVISYYDAIAQTYDEKMDTHKGHQVRALVSNYFQNIEGVHTILDFGAGTGEDLSWQMEMGYKVVFYEPSPQMAAKAYGKEALDKNPKITPLIGKNASLSNLRELPFQVDAILSNFAVLNSIEDLDPVFRVFRKLLPTQGHLVFIVNEISSLKDRLLALTRNQSLVKVSDDEGNSMPIYLHNNKSIKKMANSQDFKLMQKEVISSSNLILYHFTKN